MKRFTRDDTEHGKEYYLASEVDAAQPAQPAPVQFEVSLVEWVGNKLMATPKTPPAPQRPWVGLTDEDKHLIELSAGITEDDDGYIVSQVFKLTEAKLRSKNNAT
jgi:hypothetical protein